MLRGIFFRSRPPLLREGGDYACLKYYHANDTSRPSKPAAPTSRLRSSACVKRNQNWLEISLNCEARRGETGPGTKRVALRTASRYHFRHASTISGLERWRSSTAI